MFPIPRLVALGLCAVGFHGAPTSASLQPLERGSLAATRPGARVWLQISDSAIQAATPRVASAIQARAFELDSHEFRVEREPTIGAGGRSAGGGPVFGTLRAVGPIQQAIPDLFAAAMEQRKIGLVQVVVTAPIQGRDRVISTLTLRGAVIAGVEVLATDLPTLDVAIEFDYGRIEWTHHDVKPDGTLGNVEMGGFDRNTGESI